MNFSSQTNTDQFKKEFEEFLKEKYGAKDVEQDSLGHKAGTKGEFKSDGFNFDLKPEELEEYLNQLMDRKTRNVRYVNEQYPNVLNAALEIIELLSKEYHLK